MKDKEKIKEMLDNYRKIKARAKIEIVKEAPKYSLPAIDYSKTGASETNAIYSNVEKFVIQKTKDENILKKIIQTRDIIYFAYQNLAVEKKRIVKYIFFEELTNKETAKKMNCSENTISSRKKEIFKDLKSYGIVEAYPLWNEIKYLFNYN